MTSVAEARPRREAVVLDESIREFLGLADCSLLPNVVQEIKTFATQTSPQERATLYALARHHFRGEGEIVDLGTGAGGSAAILALGVRDSRVPNKRGRVHTFDRFDGRALKILNALGNRSIDGQEPAVDEDDLTLVRRVLAPVEEHVVLHQGDLERPFRRRAETDEVEIAHIDVAKTQKLWASVVSELAPAVIPGHTVWILQDFASFQLPWLIYGSQYLQSDSDFIGGSAPTAAMCLRFTRKPSAETVRRIVEDAFTLKEKLELVDSAYDRLARDFARLYGPRSIEIHRTATRALCNALDGDWRLGLRLMRQMPEEVRDTRRWRAAHRAIRQMKPKDV